MAYDERYEDFLNRLDLPIEAWEDKERLREELRTQLGYEPSTRQVESLWETIEEMKRERWDEPWLREHGIRRIPVHYPWGTQTRYAIQGLRGLFGREFVERIREEEGW